MAPTPKNQRTTKTMRVALVIPSEKACGVYTYSHFLHGGFAHEKSIRVELVPNTCGNNVLAYETFARELESTHDIVHIQYEFGRFGKFGVSGIATPFFYGAFTQNQKVITTLHELPQTRNPVVNFFQHYFLRTILEKSARVIVHTHHMEKSLHEWYPALASKVVMIPHGMLIPTQVKHAKRPAYLHGKKVLGFFGFIVPHKNVEAIIDALAQLPSEYAALIAGGARDQTYLEALHQRARDAGVESRIHWTGFVSDERMSDIFSWIDMVVFPYKSVTESGALHLALGEERIVLASPLPAFEEIANNYGCMIIFSGLADLVAKIKSISHSIKQIKTMKKNMKRFVADRNWKKIGSEHVSLYQQTTNN